ncbi:galactose-specific lectin nattectin-like [Notolabrus celidotus]|uniref:galactose-specific lectin nattectin-like n=1 Tax=Notolabrus celidotus TaxID=1203425 RepID=UPI00149062E1|nr:galactose-specific lectin nattectin-like [Notolabrus celidotus]
MASGLYLVAVVCLTGGLWIGADAAVSADGCKSCPAEWTQFGDHCYMYNFSPKDWADAEVSCVNHGGNLASVHTKEQYDFIRSVIKTATGGEAQTWVGGYDAAKEGVWLWSDGSKFEKFTFKFWGPHEPSNYQGKENCLEINFRGSANDIACNAKLGYMCGMGL